jgi:hypothetical protein
VAGQELTEHLAADTGLSPEEIDSSYRPKASAASHVAKDTALAPSEIEDQPADPTAGIVAAMPVD